METPPDNDFEIDGECFFHISEDNELVDCLFLFVDEDRIKSLECFLNLPDKSLMQNPLSMSNVKWHQDQCQELQQLRMQNSHQYKNEMINGVNIITYQNLQF